MEEHLHAELYDKINYMCRKYMDRMARVRLDYAFTVDAERYKAAVKDFLESAPVFHSRFVRNPINPYWSVMPYSTDDVVSVSQSDDIESDTNRFFTQTIPLENPVQIKIGIFYCGNNTSLCFLWNHMCTDGGGFKAFYASLCGRYDSRSDSLPFLTGSRGYKEVYRDLPPEAQKKAKRLFSGNFAPKNTQLFPFSPVQKDDGTIFTARTVEPDIFIPAKNKAKQYGATVNDLLIYTYAGALRKMGNRGGTLAVSGAVDLRRYIKDPTRLGYTNHTAFLYALVSPESKTPEAKLRDVVRSTKKAKADEFLGLHGLPMLSLGYHLATYAQVELIVRLFYKNPPYAVSNVGSFDDPVYNLGGHRPCYLMVGGAAKHKPCAMLTAATCNGALTVSMCVKGNEKDKIIINKFFDEFENCLSDL